MQKKEIAHEVEIRWPLFQPRQVPGQWLDVIGVEGYAARHTNRAP